MALLFFFCNEVPRSRLPAPPGRSPPSAAPTAGARAMASQCRCGALVVTVALQPSALRRDAWCTERWCPGCASMCRSPTMRGMAGGRYVNAQQRQPSRAEASVRQAEDLALVPLDAYQLLKLPRNASREQCLRAYDFFICSLPELEHSQVLGPPHLLCYFGIDQKEIHGPSGVSA